MSRILAEVHETAKDLHEAGIFSDEQQTKFNLLCLPQNSPCSMAKKKDLRIYPAVLYKDGEGYSVYYPDLPGCLTCGDDLEEALSNAREALEGFLYISEMDNDPVPSPTPIEELRLPQGHFPTLISVCMDE
jgi:predicted RNase H-like HicB family nuclease